MEKSFYKGLLMSSTGKRRKKKRFLKPAMTIVVSKLTNEDIIQMMGMEFGINKMVSIITFKILKNM